MKGAATITNYRGYDRAGLDAQYNLRARHTDALDLIQQGAERSARTRAKLKCELDIAYGEGEEERLDIFPATSRGRPVLVFIHGGYWQRLDKADYSFVAEGFVPVDVNVVTVNYGLAPKFGMDEIVRQMRASLAWIWRHAGDFGANRNRVYVCGHSAGGHLTAMMMMTQWSAFERGLPSDLVKGGCAISGIYDLEPIRLCHVNDALHMSKAEARRNSPIFMIPPTEAPLILAVGDDETDEFLRQQEAFAKALSASGQTPHIVDLPGLHHFTIVPALAEPDSVLNDEVRRQLRL